jgi:hypothetical protein
MLRIFYQRSEAIMAVSCTTPLHGIILKIRMFTFYL